MNPPTAPDAPLDSADANARALTAVAEGMARSKEAILTAWMARVRADPAVPQSDDLAELELRDHVPMLLDEIVARLRTCAVTSESGERQGRRVGHDAAARAHAVQRFRANYDVTAVIRELSHLRIVIMQACEREAAHLAGEAAVLVHMAIDEGIQTATTEVERRRADVVAREATLRETMLGVLGHDLRQPLHTVGMAADMLAAAVASDPPSLRLARLVERGAARMTSMVNELLDFTRARQIDGKGIPLVLAPASMRHVLASICEELRLANPSRVIQLDVAGELSGVWDAARLAQVFGNLLGNALAYSTPTTPVTVRASTEQDGGVTVAFANQGPPIPTELLPTLFEPFRRGPTGTRPAGASDGLGLGLYIANAIVRAHGGTIAVQSTATEGTRFVVALPREARAP